ncbi:protein CMSS1-like isoform X3 [Polyodon spathula]|uniref:protein CMSS1-like isoform X3 n=1 Tax=Polyodon spathula TaxID=7913 RepID=UPI001B7EBA00|nr:protein CMSS1-like isoform X3 [Polyodon spathula]
MKEIAEPSALTKQTYDVSEDEGEKAVEKTAEETTTKKRKIQTVKPAKAKETKTQTECVVAKKEKQEDEKETKSKRKRKKKITDILAASAPKPGCPADLQKLFEDNFIDKRSVIEMEELKLPDSCFLQSNDLTHSLSSFLKEICPKWAKLCKNHTEKSSVVMLIVCSSAHRVLDVIKQLTTFKGNSKVLKLFAKHIKVEEQIKLLQKGVTHMGVGTPGRIKALAEQDGLSLKALKYVVLDWNWRDQKLRRMADIPEVKLDMLKLLEGGIAQACQAGSVKLALF